MRFILATFFISITGCDSDPTGSEILNYSWQESSPELQGMNSSKLDSAAGDMAAKGYVDALLVIRNGYLVSEDYYNGYNRETPHNIMSVSKSFLSVITGLAFQYGHLDSLEEKMLDYFPEYVYPGMDQRKKDITIRHLLSMRMGIGGEADNDYALYREIYASDNWIKNTIELPLLSAPGEKMRYNTFQTHLLSAIITRASGMSTLDFARNSLFEPMGIDVDFWEQGPSGYFFGGNSMFFTPREMAVLGLLYLNGGLLEGRQIISADWIALSVTPTRAENVAEWGVLKEYNYGLLWWLGKINGYKLYMALGYGGQTVLVFPELDLIIVTTAYEDIPPNVDQERPILETVSRYILTALVD